MLQRLILMRHGHSPTLAEAGVHDDRMRPLSTGGRRDVDRMAAELLRRGVKPQLILHSPILRAAQTAEELAKTLAAHSARCIALDNTLPPDEALEGMRETAGKAQEIIAVGHQPQIGEIASALTKGIYEVRPAGVVAIAMGPAPKLLWALNADEI